MPLSDEQMDAMVSAQKQEPLTDQQMDHLHSASTNPSLVSKAMGYLSTGMKALNSVTLAPVEAGIYAAQNRQNPLKAAAHQFGNMTDEAPTGKDIAMKAGVSDQPVASESDFQSIKQNDPGLLKAQGISTYNPKDFLSKAGIAGQGIDIAANPINWVAPASRLAGKYLSGPAEAITINPKPNAQAIKEAAERLGFSATPGMVTDSHVVEGLESSLSQSPSIAGALTRRSIKPVATGLQTAAEDLISGAPEAETSVYAAGNDASKGIVSNLGEKVSNIKMSYEPFNQELPKMIPHAEDRWKLADEVAKIGQQHLDPNEVSGTVQGITNKIMNSQSLEDIEDTRKLLANKIDQAYSSNDKNMIDTLTKMKDKLSNFRDNQFQTLAEKAYPGPNGAAMGQQMVSEYKNAMAQHHALMSDLREVGPLFGIKAKNPRDFIEAFSEIPPEQVAKKLFQTNNYDALQKVQEYFPEEFQNIKALKLQDLKNASLKNPIDPVNSPVDPSKLIRNINKMTPEVRTILFGDKAQKVTDMQTVLGSFPEKIGPSGTPKGEMFTHMADPIQQASDTLKYGIYRTLGSSKVPSATKAAANLAKTPNVVGPAASSAAQVLRPFGESSLIPDGVSLPRAAQMGDQESENR